VFVLVSIGFECEFVGFIEVSGNDGEKGVFSNKPPVVNSEEFFKVAVLERNIALRVC